MFHVTAALPLAVGTCQEAKQAVTLKTYICFPEENKVALTSRFRERRHRRWKDFHMKELRIKYSVLDTQLKGIYLHCEVPLVMAVPWFCAIAAMSLATILQS
jgi:hypothetical protein